MHRKYEYKSCVVQLRRSDLSRASLSCMATEARCSRINLLCLLFAVISIRGRVPRILLYRLRLGLHAVHLAREVVRDGEVERSRMERYVAPAKPRPAVPCLVDPPDLIEMTYILERAEIRSPFRGLDRDKAVIRAFPFENDRVWPLPGVDQPGIVHCAPAEVFHPGSVRRLLVELMHSCYGEALECGTVTAAIREHVEEGEERWKALRPDRLEKMISKRGTAMWGRDRGDRKDAKGVVLQS